MLPTLTPLFLRVCRSVNAFRRTVILLVLTALVPSLRAAGTAAKRHYQFSPGDAATTLRQFVEQSGEQVIYLVQKVRGVKTNEVKGEYTAREVLDLLVANTCLAVVEDAKTGALTVTVVTNSKKTQMPSAPPPESNQNSPSQNSSSSMKRKNPIAVLFSWIALAIAPAGAAQAADTGAEIALSQTGVITGYVSNQVTGEMLEAATIQIEGTTNIARSERGGAFTFTLAPGSYVLVVRYTGLDALRLPVTVEAGKRITVEAPLTSNIYMLDKYTVAGQREGEARSLELQRQAENIKTVVATDAFGTAEATTPAVMLMRLPGVSGWDVSGGNIFLRGLDSNFVSLKVDGNDLASSSAGMSRAANILFSITTDNVESVELVRAPTPDMPSNAVAGQINMITRRGMDLPGRRLDLTLGLSATVMPTETPGPFSANAFNRGRQTIDFINFNFSDTYSVLGGKKNLSVLVNLSRRNFALLADQVAGTLAAAPGAAYVFPTATNGLTSPLRRAHGSGYNWVYRPLYGASLNFDYKASDRLYLYFKNTFNINGPAPGRVPLAANFFQATSTGTTADQFEAGSTYDLQRARPLAASKNELQTTRSDLRYRTYAHSVGFENKLFDGSGVLTLDASYSYALNWRPLNASVKGEVTGVGWELDRRGQPSWFPKFTQTSGPSIYDPANYRPTLITRATNYSPAKRYGLRIDFKKNMSLAVPAYFKTGVKLEGDSREQDTNQTNYTYAGPAGMTPYVQLRFKAAKGTTGEFAYPTVPGTGGTADLTDVEANRQVLTQTAADAYNSVNATYANDAKFSENINAAYVMGGTKIGMLRMMAGVRVEQTKDESQGYQKNTSAAAGTTSITTLPPAENAARAMKQFAGGMTTTKGDYKNVFPGVHFILEPARDFQVRATYNMSITRPALGSLLPINTVFEDTQLITAGNPELKPFTTNNFEVAVQKYFDPAGFLEISTFLKEIKNYTRTIDSFVGSGSDNGFDGQYVGYTLRRAQNVGGARVRGIEIGYQQQYTSLPGFWRGFGSFANYSYTQAQGDFGSTTFTRNLAGLRPRVANLGLSYVGFGAQVRLIGNWQSKYYRGGVGNTLEENGDTYNLDLKTSYQINPRYTLFFDIQNLTNEFSDDRIVAGYLKYYAKWQGAIYALAVKRSF